ncbi:glucosamine--fructose-6-phosphate aminotransferase [Enterococcus faecium]|nr:glucosamine--fructose-6-phosphate aminotransferase [Enterococcus faecium]
MIGIISEEVTGAHTRGNLKEVESRGAKTLVIVSEGLEKESDQLVLPTVHPYLTTLTTVVPTQLLAYYATLLRDSTLTNHVFSEISDSRIIKEQGPVSDI